MSGNCIAWDVGMSAYTTRDADGFYRVQIAGFANAGSQPLEAYHPVGFLGRQRDPEVDPSGAPKLGPTTLYGWEGNQGHALPLSDPRVIALLPEVKGGGSIQYAHLASGVSYVLLDGDDGTCTIKVGNTTAVVDETGIELGGASAKTLVNADLLTWITTVLIPPLNALLGPGVVTPPPPTATTTTTRAA